MRVTERPARSRWTAVTTPLNPAPMTAICVVSDIISWWTDGFECARAVFRVASAQANALSVPPALHEPLAAAGVAAGAAVGPGHSARAGLCPENPDERSILCHAAEIFARIRLSPRTSRDAIGTRRRFDHHPAVRVAVLDGKIEVATPRGLHRDRPRLLQKLEREPRLGGRFPDEMRPRSMCRLLCQPRRAPLEQWMTGVGRNDNHRSLIVEQLGDRFLSRARGGESAVEDVTLSLDFTGHCLDAESDARDSIGQHDRVEMRTDETHPRLAARRRAGGAHEMLVARSVGERKNERHLASALAPCGERSADIIHEIGRAHV